MTAAEEAPEGVHYYESAHDVPQDLVKYWHQRQKIFSKYDEGIWLTDDAWFGVTPEPIAKYVTSLCRHVILADSFAERLLIKSPPHRPPRRC